MLALYLINNENPHITVMYSLVKSAVLEFQMKLIFVVHYNLIMGLMGGRDEGKQRE